MSSPLHAGASRSISEKDIAEYERDGAICLRGLFDRYWIERMRDTIEVLMENARRREIRQSPICSFSQYCQAANNADLMDFALRSPAAGIARTIMRSRRVQFYFEQIFVKEPQKLAPSPWHHDLPFWPVQGDQVCSVWLALDPVTRESSGLEYVRGSHRWGRQFRPPTDSVPGFAQDDKMPDINANRSEYTLLNWDMEPGDCLVHHGLTVHGAGGNMTLDIRRRALATRWVGDNATYRAGGGDIPLRVEGLRTGDAMPADRFPFVEPN